MGVKQFNVGFIGAGNMASSIIAGLLEQGLAADHILAADPDSARLESLRSQAPIRTSRNNADIVAGSDVVILAVKPQMMAAALDDIGQSLRERGAVTVSIAAGITIDSLENKLGREIPIVRCMPNTPALLRQGASALFANAATGQDQREMASAVLGAVGTVCWLENESQMDTVTAVSGSGPAYFFLLMEALAAAGEELGLDARTSHALVVQTALGAARMAAEGDVDLAELRRRVTSPGGTTQAAIQKLKSDAFPGIVAAAVRAAADRSRELAAEMG